MIEPDQVSKLYLCILAGIVFGFSALVVTSLNYLSTRRNRRAIKSILQGIELILAGQGKFKDDRTETRSFLEKTLRELEHDNDKVKDSLEGYANSLQRIETEVRAIKENQHAYLIKNNSAANGNRVKITSPKQPEAYEAGLVTALIRSLVDKMQHLSDNTPGNKPPDN